MKASGVALALAVLLAWAPASLASSQSTRDLKAYKAAERAARRSIDGLKPAMNAAEQAFIDKANQCRGVIARLPDLPKAARSDAEQELALDLTGWAITARVSAISEPLATFGSQLQKLRGSVDPVLRRYAAAQLRGYRALAGPTDPDLCAAMSAWAASGFETFNADEQAIQAWLLHLALNIPSAGVERRFKADLRKHHLKRGSDDTRIGNAILPEARLDRDLAAMLLVLLDPGAASPPAVPGTLRIYSSLPLQGDNRPQTSDVVAGERMALDEAGGVAGGHPINLVSLDDSTRSLGKWDPGATSSDARKAAQDSSTIAYLGEFNSGASAISIPILNEAGILQVSPSNTYVGLTRREGADVGEPDKYYPTGQRTYGRVAPADHLQSAAIATLLTSLHVGRVLLLNDGEVYGAGLARMVRRHALANGITVRGPLRAGLPRYGFLAFGKRARARLKRLVLRTHADAMVFGGITDNHAAQIFETAHRAAPGMLLIGADGVAESAFTTHLAAGAARRTWITDPTVPIAEYTPAGQAFAQAFSARYGHEPEPYAIFGYEAMKVVLAAIDAGGGRRAATVRAFFATHDRDSVLGRYSIDSNGDTTLSTYGVYRVEHGGLVFDRVLDSSVAPAP